MRFNQTQNKAEFVCKPAARRFDKGEDYHQDYFRNHPNAPYCAVVISPKLEKLKPRLAKP